LFRPNLQLKILAVTVGLIVFLGAALILPLRSTVSRLFAEELRKRGASLSARLSEEVVDPLITNDTLALNMCIDKYERSSDDIEYVFVRDRTGAVQAHTFNGGFPTDLAKIQDRVSGHGVDVQRLRTTRGDVYDFAVPLLAGEAGVAHIGISSAPMEAHVAKLKNLIQAIVLGVSFIGGVLALFFSRAVTRPLVRLSEMAAAVGRGDLEQKVVPGSQDEIGILATTFNRMTENLRKSTGKLLDANASLEQEISDRIAIQDELNRSVRFLNTVFYSIRDPFVIIDEHFRISRANAAYANLKGRTLTELTNGVCYKLLEGRTAVCPGCVVDKTFRSGDPSAKEKHVTDSKGNPVWIMIYTYPVLDEAGKVSHVIEYTRDITEAKRADEEKQRLIGELQHRSRIDGLTGVCNHRTILARLNYETTRAQRYGKPLSVVLLDLDDFKEINDNHGHPVGDELLLAVAGALVDLVRSADQVGRYGGDEFLLVLPETTLTGALDLAERLRKTVAETRVPVDDGRTVGVTASVGVSACAEDLDAKTLIKRVDEALYGSKRRGKNCVYGL